jgi:hypothetical protein
LFVASSISSLKHILWTPGQRRLISFTKYSFFISGLLNLANTIIRIIYLYRQADSDPTIHRIVYLEWITDLFPSCSMHDQNGNTKIPQEMATPESAAEVSGIEGGSWFPLLPLPVAFMFLYLLTSVVDIYTAHQLRKAQKWDKQLSEVMSAVSQEEIECLNVTRPLIIDFAAEEEEEEKGAESV